MSDYKSTSSRDIRGSQSSLRSGQSFTSSSLSFMSLLRLNKMDPDAVSQRAWIERVFSKRECVRFIPSLKDKNRCGCGRLFNKHYYHHQGRTSPISSDPLTTAPHLEKWNVYRHSELSSTDAFGTIEFQGGPHPTKAQYVRLSHDTRPDLILQLFQKQWMLELPKLLISVHGGIANFDLQPKLKRVFRKGLLKAAKTTGAWIVTGGTNTGVMRHVGDALGDTLQQSRNHIVTIGCAPWGVVDNRDTLLGKDTVTPYHAIACPKSNNVVLNSNHSYFLLVDNGTVGKYGGEILLRKKLEKHISQQKITTRSTKNHGIPVVVVILEGGTNTIRTVLECVTDTPPVPVVVCDGSGRAADLLAFTHKYAQDDGTMAEGLRDQLLLTIEKTFQYSHEQAEKLFIELMLCVKKKELITVFRMGEGSQDIDMPILTALLKGQNVSAPDQLSLALSWDRVDIARSHIFVYGQEWPEGALEQAMMDALVSDRVDFVQLLLENGVSMQKFLTIPRLEELYNIKQGHINTLKLLVQEFKKHIPPGYRYTLLDIGQVIEYLMGGAYRASYLRRKFRNLYCAVMKKQGIEYSQGHYIGNFVGDLPLPIDAQQFQKVFRYPFHELMVWAILMRRQKMALFMWQHGEEALAKSLVAMRLYKRMAHEAAQDDLEVEVSEELKNNFREFSKLAHDLLDHCYQADDDKTEQLLTYELSHWSDQTCLSLAVTAVHREFLAHTCCQILLTDMWMGGLRMRKYTSLKVILGILIPFTIFMLEFKSREELQMMPQTVEEHIQELEDSDSEDSSVNMEFTDDRSEAGVTGEHNDPSTPHASENGKLISSTPNPSFAAYSRKKSSLTIGKKIYEFYNAPVTKFWAHSMAYLAFLMFFTYEVIVKLERVPRFQEIIVILYIYTLALEKIREIISSEPTKITQKIAVYFYEFWNIWDAIAILLFIIGMGLRLNPSTQMDGHVFYCVDIIFWYVRILDIFSVNKYLGPYVMIVGKMVKDTLTFVIILLVVLMSFGVARQGLRHPYEAPHWQLARDIFMEPYFMLYGEVYAPDIDPPCGGEGEVECHPGRWITPAIMTIYLIVANILLINLLIAVFNNTFNRVNAISTQIWKFQRYSLVIEYEQKPILPPPLIVFCHVYLAIKFFYRICKGKRKYFDNGLKLFLEEDDVEKVHDFEEECMEDLFREKNAKCKTSTEERIRLTNERVENMSLRMDDMNQKENSIKMSLQTVDYRLAKLEELALQTAESLTSIQEFLYRTYTNSPLDNIDARIRGHIESMTSTSREASVEEDGMDMGFSSENVKFPRRQLASQASPLVVHPTRVHKERRLGPFTDYTKSSHIRPPFSRSVTVAVPGYYDKSTVRSLDNRPVVSLMRGIPSAEKAVKITASDGFGGPPHLTSSLYQRRRARALNRLKTQPFKGKPPKVNTKPFRSFVQKSAAATATDSPRSAAKVKFKDVAPNVTSLECDSNSVFSSSTPTPVTMASKHESSHLNTASSVAYTTANSDQPDVYLASGQHDVTDAGDRAQVNGDHALTNDQSDVVENLADSIAKIEESNVDYNSYESEEEIGLAALPDGLLNREDDMVPLSGAALPGGVMNKAITSMDMRAGRMPMTPILTPLRADYTSITDEIDTSCIMGDSPRASPVPSSAHHFFYDDDSDVVSRTGSPEKEAVRTELEQLKLAEETEHRQLEGIIRNRMRQISLTESDSLSDIAKHVVQEMEKLHAEAELSAANADYTTDEDQFFDAAEEELNAEGLPPSGEVTRRRHRTPEHLECEEVKVKGQTPSPAAAKRQAYADRDEHAVTMDSTC